MKKRIEILFTCWHLARLLHLTLTHSKAAHNKSETLPIAQVTDRNLVLYLPLGDGSGGEGGNRKGRNGEWRREMGAGEGGSELLPPDEITLADCRGNEKWATGLCTSVVGHRGTVAAEKSGEGREKREDSAGLSSDHDREEG